MDLSLSFYDVTENTNEDSFKNEESNIILNHIVKKNKRLSNQGSYNS